MRFTFTLVALSGLGIVPLLAQEGSGPAPVLQIFREAIKEGRNAAHEKVEADYAAAYRKAGHPGRYVALSAMSGPSEVWFIVPMPSFAAGEEYDKFSDKEPFKSAVAMLDARDGEVRSASRSTYAVYRPDLSYHADKFAPGKARFVTVGTFRVKLGREDDFTQGGKTYWGAFEKANVDQVTLAYQVVAGAPAGTYLFFTMMDSMKAMDGEPARMQAVMQAMGTEKFAAFMKNTGDLFVSIEDTMFQVKPGMSYPPQSMVDADPGFWKPKPAPKPVATAAPAPPAAEKKAAQ
jgi:hypothetical protein